MIAPRGSYETVLELWFGEDPDDALESNRRFESWFNTSDENDAIIRDQFSETLERAMGGELEPWTTTARGSLALVILFDQVTRTIYRGQAAAFASDERAIAIAESAIARGYDRDVRFIQRLMFYLPFEHGEDLESQNRCVDYFKELDDIAAPGFKEITQKCLISGKEHREVVRRFGRFPHRNIPLGRISTDEELAWIAQHHGWGQAQKSK